MSCLVILDDLFLGFKFKQNVSRLMLTLENCFSSKSKKFMLFFVDADFNLDI